MFSTQRPAILSPILFCRYASDIFSAAGRKEEPAVSFSNQCVIHRPFYAFCFAFLYQKERERETDRQTETEKEREGDSS